MLNASSWSSWLNRRGQLAKSNEIVRFLRMFFAEWSNQSSTEDGKKFQRNQVNTRPSKSEVSTSFLY